MHLILISRAAEFVTRGHFDTPAEVAAWLVTAAPVGGIVAVDEPLRTSEGLLLDPAYRRSICPPPAPGRYLNYRECDYQLIRRGLPLYQVPHRYPDCPGWMHAGFALYDALLRSGCWSLFDGDSSGNRVAEVYPFAAFAALTGSIPPVKQTVAGRAARIAALEARLHGFPPPDSLSHHDLDAAVAAVTALALRDGTASWVGNPREALIVSPASLLDRYHKAAIEG